MFLQLRSRIYLALFIAVMLACGLYFIGREAKPLGLGTTTQTFWADELNDWYGTSSWSNTARTDAGVMLSRLHPVYDFKSGYYDIHLTALASGRLLLSVNDSTYTFDSMRHNLVQLKIPFNWNPSADLILTPAGKIYGIERALFNSELSDQQDRLFELNPDTGQTQLLTSIVSDTWYLVADRRNLIFGFGRGLWPTWKYDPVSTQFMTLTTTDQVRRLWNAKPQYGADGLLYGSYDSSLGGPYYIAAVDLEQHFMITREVPFPGSALLPNPEGGAYLNLHGISTFNPDNATLVPLESLPIHDLSNVMVEQATIDGWLYGVGSQTKPDAQFIFAYQPQSQRLKITYPTGQRKINQIILGADKQLYALTVRSQHILHTWV